jgi:HD-GYP domain-containing protein (c-di-GMP phosphodiesterase class II)/plastocyanin
VKNFLIASGLLAALVTPICASDIVGSIRVERQLTPRTVTALASAYQRGQGAGLGLDQAEDPLSFERSHVVVYLEGKNLLSSPATTAATAEIAQRDRRFVPDLVAISAGSTVSLPNRDAIFHNVFSLSKAKMFDLGNYGRDQTRSVVFPVPGIVFVNCRLRASSRKRSPWIETGTRPLNFSSPCQRLRSLRPTVRRSKLQLGARTFLCFFVPVTGLLTGSFWSIERRTLSTVRAGTLASLRQSQKQIAKTAARQEERDRRLLAVIGSNPALLAGIQLLRLEPGAEARATVEDQLREIAGTLALDLLAISGPNGSPLAGIRRQAGELAPMRVTGAQPISRGLIADGGVIYRVTTVPLNQGEENIATLAAGEAFDLTQFGAPLVLSFHGAVAQSSLARVPATDIQRAMSGCGAGRECEASINGELYLSAPIADLALGDGYELRAIQNVDEAAKPMREGLKAIFLTASALAIAAAGIVSAVASRSIVKPIVSLVAHLKASESTGALTQFQGAPAKVQEIRELIETFGRAGLAIRQSQLNLQAAYMEFVGSLASALDARDPYTAGHSTRVSQYAVAVARAMHLDDAGLHTIEMGGLLHDIGKIGIADSVLQKPGRLTAEEFALIQEHPTIGRRILAGVNGFQLYLPIVELHHENWDGSGYPARQRGTETPLFARIVHVVDAYDAMTSDRSYRNGLGHAEAIRRLEQGAGTQFDPEIVSIFTTLANAPSGAQASGLLNLSRALSEPRAFERETVDV